MQYKSVLPIYKGDGFFRCVLAVIFYNVSYANSEQDLFIIYFTFFSRSTFFFFSFVYIIDFLITRYEFGTKTNTKTELQIM